MLTVQNSYVLTLLSKPKPQQRGYWTRQGFFARRIVLIFVGLSLTSMFMQKDENVGLNIK